MLPSSISRVVLTLVIAASGNCCADIILLRDGTLHEGEIIRETPHSITLQKRLGGILGSVILPKAEIAAIQAKPVAPDRVVEHGALLQKEAEAAAGEPAKVAQAWVRVGEYYARHAGYSAQAREAFEKALAFDDNQPAARRHLGFVIENGRWVEAPKPKLAAAEKNAADQNAPPVADEIVIGLRRDDELVKRIIDEQAARQRQDAEIERRLAEFAHNDSFTSYGYTRDYFYVGPYGSTYFYAPYDSCYSPCIQTGFGGHHGYGGRFGGYSGYSGYGCGSSFYGSGVGIRFSGNFGSVRVNGSFNSGGCYAGFNPGVLRYGF